jgi:opacity protein-like surface antigen
VIDEHIDDERSKVVNDLTFTGCVEAVQLVPRPWAPADVSNGTGQTLVTDGAIAVVKLNDFGPEAMQHPVPRWTAAPARPLMTRASSQFLLTTRNDLLRDNLAVSAVTGIRALRHRNQLKSDVGLHRLGLGGDVYLEQADESESSMIPVKWTPAQQQQFDQEAQRTYKPPHLEFSISAGVPRFPQGSFSNQAFTAKTTTQELPFAVGNALEGRWTLGARLTLNHGNRLAHEFGYEYNRAALTFISPDFGNSSSPAEIRRFSYNLLFALRGRSARIRPYVSVGPALQLTKLTDAVIRQSNYFKFGLRNIGLFTAAWDFGSKPPLEGGGIFQPALQYGAGVKWYLSSRWSLRADYRESLSRAPDFWTKSYASVTSTNTPDMSLLPGRLTLSGPLRQQNFTLGIGVGF